MKIQIKTHPEVYFPKVISEIRGFAIFMIDSKGTITSWNKGCEGLKEYTSEEVIGKNYEILFPDFLREKGLPQEELDGAFKNGRYETENWRRKKSGELFWALVVLTKVVDDDGNFVGFIKITQDQSEKKKLEEENRKKIEDLKKINTDLDTFVYTASHDLKAPLNNIEGLVTSLQDEMGDEVKLKLGIKKIMDMIKTSTNKFRSIITDMAVSARIDMENKKYPDQSFIEILEEIKSSLFDEIKRSGAKFYEDVAKAPTIKYSRKNIRSILYNLISNAIKYRHKDRAPEITIRTSKEDGYILLEISDNGIGIKEEDKQKVFSMYQRLATNGHESKLDIEGTGVGMAIVAKIVETNGGKIEIQSQPGQGSVFRVYLRI